jgi:hypothetical protein
MVVDREEARIETASERLETWNCFARRFVRRPVTDDVSAMCATSGPEGWIIIWRREEINYRSLVW